MRKFIMFPLTRLIVALAFIGAGGFAATLISNLFPPQIRENNPLLAQALIYLIATPLIILAYLYYVRLIENRRVTELSMPGAWRESGAGLLAGAGLMVLSAVIIAIMGGIQLLGLDSFSGMMLGLVLSLGSGIIEEIIFRGIIFRLLEELLGSWAAIIISSLIFGFSHLSNTNATIFSSVAISIEAGLLLAAAYMLTRRLWLVIGIHIAWNFVLGGILGLAVSGITFPGLLKTELVGSKLLTGGEFGLESSIVVVLICTGLAIYLLARAWKAGQILLPCWMRSAPVWSEGFGKSESPAEASPKKTISEPNNHQET